MKRTRVGNAGRWLAALLLCAVVLTLSPVTVHAAGAEASVSVDRTEAQVGDTVTLTVRIQSDGTNLGELAYRLSYTNSVLSLEDASGNDFGGSVNWASAPVGAPSYAETFVFTVIAEGPAEISFAELPTVQDEDGNPLDCTFSAEATWVQAAGTAETTSSAAETTAPSTAGSSAAETPSSAAPTTAPSALSDLSALTVTPGSITFDPSVTDYTIEVGNDVTRVAVSAVTADENATYIVENYDNLQVGENVVTVHVSGSDGSSKDYRIHVMRADADGKIASATEETIEGFEWTTEGRTYYITTFPDGVSIPAGYTYTTVTIGNYEVPAYANGENRGLYLIYAQENGQEAGLCWYRSADGFVFPFVNVSSQESGFSVSLPILILFAVLVVALIVLAVIAFRRRGSEPKRPGPRADRTIKNPEEDGDDADDWDDEDDDSEEEIEEEDEEEEETDPADDKTDDFGVDIRLMQAGIEKEVSAYGAVQPAKSGRPKKPVVDARRINEATTRIDADRVRQSREKK